MTQPADPRFVADVKRAAGVWSGDRAVPAAYLLLALAYALLAAATPLPPEECARKVVDSCPLRPEDRSRSTLLGLAILPLALFHIGLSGTARVWYARRFAGSSMAARDVWALSWRFFGRFLVLGLLFAAVLMPFLIAGLVLLANDQRMAYLLVTIAGTVLCDVMFTFATTGLALFNPSAWQAFKGGLLLLRRSWPECAAYALVPPLALTLIGSGYGPSVSRPLTVLAAFAGPLFTLLFAGAATSFALRRYPAMGPSGTLLDRTPWTTYPGPLPRS